MSYTLQCGTITFYAGMSRRPTGCRYWHLAGVGVEMYALEVSRYRHGRYRLKILAISISFTAAFFGLLVYFIIVSKVVNDVNVIP